jgi:WXXGXW repeat (2 copies)
MNFRKKVLAIALASALVAPFSAYAGTVLIIDAAPPAPPVFTPMPARQGYIITPGYYRYDADSREPTWVKGDYQAERRGEHYVASEWRAEDGKYHFNEGRWEHDK